MSEKSYTRLLCSSILLVTRETYFRPKDKFVWASLDFRSFGGTTDPRRIKMTSTDELRCSLCSQLYSSPRVLPCLHSFCEACLKNHQENVCGEGELTCPVNFCQESAGEISLDELPTNVWLESKISVETSIERISKGKCDICGDSSSSTFCTDCGIALCGGCITNWHNRNKLYKNHSLVPITESAESARTALVNHFAQSTRQKHYCSNHDGREAEFSCHDCKEFRCYLCCLSGSCKDHDYKCITDIAKGSRSSLKDSVQSLTSPAEKLKSLFAECKKTKDQVSAHEKECEETIEAVVSERIATLMKQKKELLTQCHTIAQSKRTRLDLQMEQIQRMTQQIEHSFTVVSQACSDHTDTELLAVSDEMVQRVEKLNGEFAKEKLYPCTTDAIVTNFNYQHETWLGEIFEGCYSPNCILEVRNTITCSLKKETKLRLVTQNEEGDLYTRGGDKVEATLVRNDGETLVKILDNEDGTYQLVFTPNLAGEYQLFVKIQSNQIMGSPFKVTVHTPYPAKSSPSIISSLPSLVLPGYPLFTGSTPPDLSYPSSLSPQAPPILSPSPSPQALPTLSPSPSPQALPTLSPSLSPQAPPILSPSPSTQALPNLSYSPSYPPSPSTQALLSHSPSYPPSPSTQALPNLSHSPSYPPSPSTQALPNLSLSPSYPPSPSTQALLSHSPSYPPSPSTQALPNLSHSPSYSPSPSTQALPNLSHSLIPATIKERTAVCHAW